MGSLFRFAKVFRRMDLDKAEKAISAGRQAAQEMGVNFSLAIMDIGANLVAFVRMDGCPVGCTDVAIKKARTAALFGFETGMLGKMSQPGKPLYGVEHSNGGLITFPGGVPIKLRTYYPRTVKENWSAALGCQEVLLSKISRW